MSMENERSNGPAKTDGWSLFVFQDSAKPSIFWSTYNPIPINCSLVGDLHIWDKGCLIFGGWETYWVMPWPCQGWCQVASGTIWRWDLWSSGRGLEGVLGAGEPLGARGKFSVSRLKFGICHSWPNFLIHFWPKCCHIKPSTFSGRLWGMVTSGDWPWPLEIHLDWPKILVISTQNWMIWTYSFLITLSWIIQSYSVSTSYTETQKKCGSVPIIIWVCHNLCRSNQPVPLWRAQHLETGSF